MGKKGGLKFGEMWNFLLHNEKYEKINRYTTVCLNSLIFTIFPIFFLWTISFKRYNNDFFLSQFSPISILFFLNLQQHNWSNRIYPESATPKQYKSKEIFRSLWTESTVTVILCMNFLNFSSKLCPRIISLEWAL